MKSTRRMCLILLAAFLGFILFWAGCGTDNDELKIIIEDTTEGAAPAPTDTADPSPAPEPVPTPEPGVPPGPGDTALPSAPPTGDAKKMNMDVLEVVSLAASSPEFEQDEILEAFPKMMVGNRPQNALWGVRLMIKDTIIAEYVIDDNTRTIVMTETYFDRVRDALKGRDETEIKRRLETRVAPTLGYDGALKAAMTSMSFPELDTAREFWVSIVYLRFEKNPTWHVSVGYKESEDFTHIIIDDVGTIIEVKDSP